MSAPGLPVLVYGASGHTGRFVVAELIKRGHRPILAGRDPNRLKEVAGGEIRVAPLDASEALDAALEGCAAVINCAGPFLDTAEPLIEAALRARIPYLDVAAEQAYALDAFSRFGDAARQAETPVLPAVAFYGGLGDLLATVTLGDWTSADQIEIAIALSSWRPTAGTRLTGQRNTAPRLMVREQTLQPIETPAPQRRWAFPAPFGDQEVVELSFTEMALIPRHLQSREVRSYFSTKPLAELRDPDTPAPTAVDAKGRSDQVFLLECVVTRGGARRRGWLTGQDIYAVTAPLVVSAAERAAELKVGGVFAPGEIFDAYEFLSSLSPEPFRLHLEEPRSEPARR